MGVRTSLFPGRSQSRARACPSSAQIARSRECAAPRDTSSAPPQRSTRPSAPPFESGASCTVGGPSSCVFGERALSAERASHKALHFTCARHRLRHAQSLVCCLPRGRRVHRSRQPRNTAPAQAPSEVSPLRAPLASARIFTSHMQMFAQPPPLAAILAAHSLCTLGFSSSRIPLKHEGSELAQ